MKALHVRNVPEETLRGLKRRAARHRRSLQQELQVVLEQAARMLPEEEPAGSRLSLEIVHSGVREDRWNREGMYGDDGR